MAAVVNIVSRRDLSINACHTNQPNRNKLALYKLLIHIYSCFKKLQIHNKAIHFSYKGGCGMHGRHTHVYVIKRIVGLG